MKKSVLIAVLVTISAVLWMLSGVFLSDEPNQAPKSSVQQQTEGDKAAKPSVHVAVRHSKAQSFQDSVVMTGRTQAARTVTIRSEVEGQVKTLNAEKGDRVAARTLLLQLDVKDRYAKLLEAQGRVKQRQIEFDASQSLEEQGYNSRVRLAQSKADLEAAIAAEKTFATAYADTRILAPFGAVINKQFVEVGGYVSVGQDVFELVELDPIEVRGFVTERQVGQMVKGKPATIKLANGAEAAGEVSYVSPAADQETRTFEIEITAPNPDFKIIAGVTADVSVLSDEIMAHKISPAILTLDDNGNIGVRIVDENGLAQFAPVKIISDKQSHMWIAGLPDAVDIVISGQEYVANGEPVDAEYVSDISDDPKIPDTPEIIELPSFQDGQDEEAEQNGEDSPS